MSDNDRKVLQALFYSVAAILIVLIVVMNGHNIYDSYLDRNRPVPVVVDGSSLICTVGSVAEHPPVER